MGVELELGVLLALSILGQSTFAVFEVETPAWRKVLKWTVISVLTLLIYRTVVSGPLAGEASDRQKRSESSLSPEGGPIRAFMVPALFR